MLSAPYHHEEVSGIWQEAKCSSSPGWDTQQLKARYRLLRGDSGTTGLRMPHIQSSSHFQGCHTSKPPPPVLVPRSCNIKMKMADMKTKWETVTADLSSNSGRPSSRRPAHSQGQSRKIISEMKQDSITMITKISTKLQRRSELSIGFWLKTMGHPRRHLGLPAVFLRHLGH